MSEADITPFPKAPLYAIFGLVLFSLLAVAVVQLTGTGGTPRSSAPIASVREFRFIDRTDGSVGVFDMERQAEVGMLAPAQDGFVRGVLRSMARERRANIVGATLPFRLTRRTDGSMFILDPATGRAIELDAFGHTNEEAFERLMNLGTDAVGQKQVTQIDPGKARP